MGEHEAPGGPANWWEKVKQFEPARVRYVIVGLVTVLGIWGLDLTAIGDNITGSWDILYSVIAVILTGETIRRAVTPARAVVVKRTPTGDTVTGPAAESMEGVPVRSVIVAPEAAGKPD